MGKARIEHLGLAGLAIEGDVDVTTAPAITQAAMELGSLIRLDLSRCTFMDSSGISALIEIKRHAEGKGGSLSLVRPSLNVTRLLTICGLIDAFTIE